MLAASEARDKTLDEFWDIAHQTNERYWRGRARRHRAQYWDVPSQPIQIYN
jgi:hypothetical protein